MGYWPAEKRVKKHYKQLGYTVSDWKRLDFMMLNWVKRERFAVEVKTDSGEFLSLEQLLEMKRLREEENTESFVAFVRLCDSCTAGRHSRSCDCPPIEIFDIRQLVDEIYKALETDFSRARMLGKLLKISSADLVSGHRVPNDFTRLAGSQYPLDAPAIVCAEGLAQKETIDRRAESNQRGRATRATAKANQR
jgi:hypothetical protein